MTHMSGGKELVERLRELIKAIDLIEQLLGEWRPIEEAPKDGTHLLLSDGENVTTGRFVESGWYETNSDPADYWDGSLQPTHYRPLPLPPGSE